MYIMLPSKLNEYPNGKTKATILSLQPNFSSSSVNLGKTASLLVVVNAINKGTLMRRNNSGILFLRIIHPAVLNTIHNKNMPTKKTNSNPYKIKKYPIFVLLLLNIRFPTRRGEQSSLYNSLFSILH